MEIPPINQPNTVEGQFRQEAIDKASENLAAALAKKENVDNMVEAVAFHYFIAKNLCLRLTSRLKAFGYSPRDIKGVVDELVEIPEFEAVSILTLNDRQLRIMFDRVKESDTKVADILEFIPEKFKSTVGFHVTAQKIRPQVNTSGRGKQIEQWIVNGTENDHRDSDLPMAYYSFDYAHLYRQNRGDYLYVVQSLPTHRSDPTNNWGRAPSLQIIIEMKVADIKDYIEKFVEASQV